MMNTSHNALLTPQSEEWTEEQWTTFREWLNDTLKVATCVVTFTKKDGDTRVMTCTLQPEQLPKVEIKEGAVKREPNLNNMSVYDLNAEGWRSFIVRNVKNVEIKL